MYSVHLGYSLRLSSAKKPSPVAELHLGLHIDYVDKEVNQVFY